MILALDLGTTTGYALLGDVGIVSGVWHLPPAQPSRAYAALRARLAVALDFPVGDARRPELIAYEDVPAGAHRGGDAAHRWGGFQAVLLAECERTRTPYLGIKPATWKRAAGLRSATGEAEALAAAQERWPRVRFATADECVARFVAVAAAERMTKERA